VLLTLSSGFLECRSINDMQCFGRAYLDAGRSGSAIGAQVTFVRFGLDAARNLDSGEHSMRRMGDDFHGAERAGDDAGLAADAAGLVDLHNVASVKNRAGRAGVEAGRILALVTGRHRRDLKGADQMQPRFEMRRRQRLDIARRLMCESASNLAGTATNAFG